MLPWTLQVIHILRINDPPHPPLPSLIPLLAWPRASEAAVQASIWPFTHCSGFRIALDHDFASPDLLSLHYHMQPCTRPAFSIVPQRNPPHFHSMNPLCSHGIRMCGLCISQTGFLPCRSDCDFSLPILVAALGGIPPGHPIRCPSALPTPFTCSSAFPSHHHFLRCQGYGLPAPFALQPVA
jgi:hypothetical protein